MSRVLVGLTGLGGLSDSLTNTPARVGCAAGSSHGQQVLLDATLPRQQSQQRPRSPRAPGSGGLDILRPLQVWSSRPLWSQAWQPPPRPAADFCVSQQSTSGPGEEKGDLAGKQWPPEPETALALHHPIFLSPFPPLPHTRVQTFGGSGALARRRWPTSRMCKAVLVGQGQGIIHPAPNA